MKRIDLLLDAKGIELVRRDNCALAKRCQKKTLDALMYKRDIDLAIKELAEELQTIVNNTVELNDYRMSKARRKDYKNENLPHLNVCKKMAKRNPGSEPQVGDRVPFVLLCVKSQPKAKTCDKAEDIEHVRRNPDECKIDRLYYVEHQIEKPICSLLEHVIEDPEALFFKTKTDLTLQQTNQRTIFDILGVKRTQTDVVEVRRVDSECTNDLMDTMMNISSRAAPSRPVQRRRKK